MSRISELLSELFGEMAKEQSYGAGAEKELAGVDFLIQVEIKADTARRERKAIEKYKEERKSDEKKELDSRTKSEKEDKILTYYITDDDVYV